MRKSKELGQVFLRDRRYLNRIFRALDIEDNVVVEIGPGRGAITTYLVKKARHLWCIEIDGRFVRDLREKFYSFSNFQVIHKDILKLNLSKLISLSRKIEGKFQGKPMKPKGHLSKLVLFGNVPYNISYQLIQYIIEQRAVIETVYFTFQKEFAQKLSAHPKDKAYSFLSCYFQCFCHATLLFEIPRSAFSPKPKVDSTFTKIIFRDTSLCERVEEAGFFKMIKAAFAQRRKKLINSLAALYPRGVILKMCEYADVSPDARAENVFVEGYYKMFSCLKSLRDSGQI